MIGKHDKPAVVLTLYRAGYSTRAVARLLGISKSHVGKLVKIAGASRDRTAAIQLACTDKPSTNPRTCRAQARRKVTRVQGAPLPRKMDVHHRDGDCTNNALDNLEVIDHAVHTRLHNPKNPIPRHLRPERQTYMRNYLRTYRRRWPA